MRGIGPARARVLAAAGYRTVEDLLYHLPSRYEDRRAVRPISQVMAEGSGGPHTLEGRLSGLRLLRTRRRGFNVVHGTLADATGALPVVWFNRPYLPRQVEEGREYVLSGPVREARGGGLELLNPSCEPAGEALHGARVVPVYPAVRALGAPALRRLLAALLDQVDLAQVEEAIPGDLRARHGLPALGEALAALHRPGAQASPEAVEALNRRRSPGHLRLIYGELLEHQVELALLRALEIAVPRAHRYRIDDRLRAVARSLLPFPLTGAQKRALAEIAADLGGRWPMLRLLQGDVGSGKTIVAALALVIALESGLQGAFMAPTELLAEQHHANLRRLLAGRYRIGLLTGSNPEAPRLRAALASGEVQLAVGTHALIQEGVAFRRLGLAVIDEQHRFGVAQRQLLARKGERPDLLVMTATPIPRSLALTAYGDLEVSVLDELPPGRRPVITEVQPAGRRREVYGRLAAALAGGARAYVVFPAIEGSEAASVTEMGERVRRFLGDVPPAKIAVVHGRLAAAEREAAMRAFAAGEARVLLATTVIEVGVDVPEATWMVIEGAERFGLSQLHQLRGRVGRGGEESRCVAIAHRPTPEARERLAVFASTTDGFRIAEADLARRGPGDLLGTRQAGLPAFRAADLAADREWLERARSDARELLPRMAAGELEPLRRRLEPRVQARAGRLGGG